MYSIYDQTIVGKCVVGGVAGLECLLTLTPEFYCVFSTRRCSTREQRLSSSVSTPWQQRNELKSFTAKFSNFEVSQYFFFQRAGIKQMNLSLAWLEIISLAVYYTQKHCNDARFGFDSKKLGIIYFMIMSKPYLGAWCKNYLELFNSDLSFWG